MSIMEYNKMIKRNYEIPTYSDFYSVLSENTIYMMKATNRYARLNAISLMENVSLDEQYENKKDYDKEISDSTKHIVDIFEQTVDGEYNRLYTKTVNMTSIADNIKKKIITSTLPKCKEYMLYDNFFKPNLDVLSTAINNPEKDILIEVLGYKCTFSADDLTCMQSNVLDLISKIQTQIGKNRSLIKKMIPTDNAIRDIKDALTLKTKCKLILDAYKRVNEAYDEYLLNIGYILNEYANSEISQNKSTTLSSADKSNYDIDKDEIYDKSGIRECFTDIDFKLNAIDTILENAAIKYGIEALTESSDIDNNKKSFFAKIAEAIAAIIKYIRTTWANLVTKIKIKIDVYGKWADKHEQLILDKVNKIGTFKDNVCNWSWNGEPFILNSLDSAVRQIMPNITPGSPISAYENALDKFSKVDNSGKTTSNIYNMIMNSAGRSYFKGKNMNDKLSDQDKIERVISKYKSDPQERVLDKSDVKNYLNILKDSKNRLKKLNDTDRMQEINDLSEKLKDDMDKTKTLMNRGTYGKSDISTLNKYYNARKTILDVARRVAKDFYEENFILIKEMTHEAYQVLRNLLKNNSLNDSVEFSADEYINLASLFESSSEICMNSNLTQGGLIDKNADISDFVSSSISDEIMNKINEMKIYPIAKMTNGSILMRSDIDKNTWIYNPNDKSLVCQNTLNSIYSMDESYSDLEYGELVILANKYKNLKEREVPINMDHYNALMDECKKRGIKPDGSQYHPTTKKK